MYTYQQRLEYAKRLQRLQQAVVIKDNIHLTYQYRNRNKAFNQIDSLQDKINKAIIDDAINGNGETIKSLDKQGEKLIHDTLTNERKRINQDKKNKFINHATKSNSEYFTNIFNYRRQKLGDSLQDKIDEELAKNSLKDLSDTDKLKHLQEKFDGHGTKRLKNIVKDAMHTNESNISWIKAVEEGFNYKIWKNGRVAKGRTRPWHREKFIQAVPIDETFDIYGSYPAHMMYPGDLNGGAENVANCRCWLYYTNRIPSNLRSKTSFNISPTFQQIWEQARKPTSKLKNTIKKPLQKIKKLTSAIKSNIDNKLMSYSKTPPRLNPKKDNDISHAQEKKYKFIYGKNAKIIPYRDIVIIQKGKSYYAEIPIVKRGYDKLPKSIKEHVKTIVINEKAIGNGTIQGGVLSIRPSVINLYPTISKPLYNYDEVIWHESGHVYDSRHLRLYSISKSLKWLRAVRADRKYIKKLGYIPPNNGFVSPYAEYDYNKRKFTLFYRRYAEDFAESVRMYISNDQTLRMYYPNRYNLLKDILGDVNNV